ncbi:hypothetical protein FCV25MIE_14637, partial [Fagus crenata]
QLPQVRVKNRYWALQSSLNRPAASLGWVPHFLHHEEPSKLIGSSKLLVRVHTHAVNGKVQTLILGVIAALRFALDVGTFECILECDDNKLLPHIVPRLCCNISFWSFT